MKRIIVIDDDTDLLASLQLVLESHSYEVRSAINTKSVSGMLDDFKPDLIVLDIIMDSSLEGFNFLNDLKANPEFKDIPVIMHTSMTKALGVNMRSAIEDVDNLPGTCLIDKSGDFEELLMAIDKLLS